MFAKSRIFFIVASLLACCSTLANSNVITKELGSASKADADAHIVVHDAPAAATTTGAPLLTAHSVSPVTTAAPHAAIVHHEPPVHHDGGAAASSAAAAAGAATNANGGHHADTSSVAKAAAIAEASSGSESTKLITTTAPAVHTSTVTSHPAASIKSHHDETSSASSSSAASTASSILSSHKPMSTSAPSAVHTTTIMAGHSSTVASPVSHLETATTSASDGAHIETKKSSGTSVATTLEVAHTTLAPGAHLEQPAVNGSHPAPKGPGPFGRFCDYLKPICASLDKILPKQLFKVQSQFKQFVQMSNGKLSMCFLEHYGINPTLREVSKQDLGAICHSMDMPEAKKGSIKDFENCAAKNWDAQIDKELDRINAARLNCIKNHDHSTGSKNGTTIANITTVAGAPQDGLEHEDDEVSLINEVVNKMLNDGKDTLSKNTDINVIDISSKANSSSSASSSTSTSSSHSSAASSLASKAKLLNDPNTVVVFVDESASSKTTIKPSPIIGHDKNLTISIGSTVKPALVNSSLSDKTKDALMSETSKTMATETNKTTSKSQSSANSTSVHVQKTTDGSPVVTKTTILSPSTVKPATVVQQVAKKVEAPKKVDVKLTPTTTVLPGKAVETDKKNLSKMLTAATTLKPALKPQETLEEMFKRQEREKLEFENRLRLEREKVFKMMQRKQDEADAQSAIKALQMQRQASSSASSSASAATNKHDADEHMHKLEHERQMSIDPIGHTIKHQQYELNKQKMMARV